MKNSHIRIPYRIRFPKRRPHENTDVYNRLRVNGKYTKMHAMNGRSRASCCSNKMEDHEEKLTCALTCCIVLVLKAIMLYQMTLLLLTYAMRTYHRTRKRLCQLIGLSAPHQLKLKVRKKRKRRKFWVRPGRTSLW